MLLLERNNAGALYIATPDNDLATVASKIKTKCRKNQNNQNTAASSSPLSIIIC